MLVSKSIQLADYDEIQEGLAAAYYSNARCLGAGVPIYIPHAHRMWEYGSALQMVNGTDSVLDVGCGHSLLAPAVHFLRGSSVTEVEPLESVWAVREGPVKKLLGDKYQCFKTSLFDMPETNRYDIVFCISVLEHLPKEEQESAWRLLAKAVDRGGKLVITVDCADTTTAGDSRERETMFTTRDVATALGWLAAEGLNLGPVDLDYHGNHVNDYTFFRIIAERP